MKHATLKAAGTAALGVAIAAVGAGAASAAPAGGGLGLPTSAVTNGALPGAVSNATSALPANPATNAVTGVAGSLTPAKPAQPEQPAQPADAADQGTAQGEQAADHAPGAAPEQSHATRAGLPIPGGEGVAKGAPGLSTVTGLLPVGGAGL